MPRKSRFQFQLKTRGYTNIDALDASQGMLGKEKEKRIYKNYIQALLCPETVEGIEKGLYMTTCVLLY